MKNLLLLISVVGSISISAQVFESKIIYLDNGEADSTIRSRYRGQLSSSYYVFLYPLCGAVTTYGPQIIKEFRALQDFKIRKCNEDVLFVFDNTSGISKKQIQHYMRETFLFSEKELNFVKFTVDDTLYRQLNFGGELAKHLYVSRYKLAYRNNCKLNSIADQFLPHEQFSISLESKIQLNIDTFLVLEKDNLISYTDNHLLLLTDVKNIILDIDTRDGNVKKVETPKIDASELYCSLIAHGDTQRGNFAKKYNYLSVTANRKTFCFNSLNYHDGIIDAFFTLEAYEKNLYEYKFLDDDGKRNSYPKGIPILTAYYDLLRIDTNGHYSFNEIENITYNKKIEKYPRFANGAKISGDTFFTTNIYSPAKSDTNKAISMFRMNSHGLTFLGDLKGQTTVNMQHKLSYNNLKNFFVDINHNSYYIYDVSGDIFDLNTGKVKSSFFGDGITPQKKENFKTFIEDEKQVNLNFDIHAVNNIFDDQYLIAYYLYNGNPVFEIKDKYLYTQDIISAKKITGFENYIASKNRNNLCFSKNSIYYISIENDSYYLNTFKITRNCE